MSKVISMDGSASGSKNTHLGASAMACRLDARLAESSRPAVAHMRRACTDMTNRYCRRARPPAIIRRFTRRLAPGEPT
ncbi:hypothetical protein ABNK63_11270 [Rhodanobacter sp. IGA1.0]|uniref:Uncharacterized protein n=1 Tax=Rhodanobacter sp. IGA1.0 TaxID=3158582 RepID=A0AAU7QIS1_9GAMM